ncbi:hypothetical protein M9Y10_037513 [Tritrichomonas musculus]|uniref:Lecithin:cholesterol acyltransferase family protein n=1 Tax=Tritrichomonas musculus TaxID=1915356 RepID=A0ABR2GRK7_9EUKA
MLLLSFLITYKNPVILLPPFYGTNLYVTYNQTNLPWYCKQKENNKLAWLSTSYMGPFQMRCLFKLLTTFVDDNGKITDWPNTTVSFHDFGGIESAKYVVHSEFFHQQFASSLQMFVDHFTSLGWELKKDLFVAPYDWRIAPTFSDSFWPEFKQLIEKAYEVDKQKVTLVGFSLGGYMIHQFLTKHCPSQDWKNHFISQAILLSPSFAGDIQMLYNLWSKRIPTFPILHFTELSLAYEQMPSVHSHIPNEVVYEDVVLAIGPDGREYKGKDLYGLIMDHLLFNENARKMFDKTQEIRKEEPKTLGVKTTLLMNSKRKTCVALNFTRGFDKNPERILGEGDGTMPAYGHRWVCEHFKNITCIDFKSESPDYDHYPFIKTKRILNIVSNITYNNVIPPLENEEEYLKVNDEL